MQLTTTLFFLGTVFSCCLADNFDSVVCDVGEIPKTISSGSFIIGGQEAKPGEFPWMTQITKFGRHSCGGALIHESFVLTAGHCMGMPTTNEFVFGKHNINKKEYGQITRKASKSVTHKLYGKKGEEYDIALVKLDEPVVFSETIQPICIPPYKTQTEGMLTVTGWGELEMGGDSPDVLMKVDVPFVSDYDCRYNSEYYPSKIADSMICAGYKKGGKDSCEGDAGSPLIRHKADGKGFYHVGIVSFGWGCALPNAPGVYTETSYYTKWILETMKSMSK